MGISNPFFLNLKPYTLNPNRKPLVSGLGEGVRDWVWGLGFN